MMMIWYYEPHLFVHVSNKDAVDGSNVESFATFLIQDFLQQLNHIFVPM
jgi:hypothetical protein